MNHPNHEDWVSYHYGEVPATRSESLKQHLTDCSECRNVLAGIAGTSGYLDAFDVPKPPARQSVARLAMRWGLAAVLLLGIGISFGRFTAPKPPSAAEVAAAVMPVIQKQIREQVFTDFIAGLSGSESDLTNDFRRSIRKGLEQWNGSLLAASQAAAGTMVSELASDNQTKREADRAQILGMLSRLDSQRSAEIKGLRKDLETVAVVAESRLDQTQTALGDLASYQLTSTRGKP